MIAVIRTMKRQIKELKERIEKLEDRPILYQRKDSFGRATGTVYKQGQNTLHNPTELDYIQDKNSEKENE